MNSKGILDGSDAESHDNLLKRVSCPRCNSTDVTRLWRVELVLPGDNSDNSTKAWRYACNACRASEWIERKVRD